MNQRAKNLTRQVRVLNLSDKDIPGDQVLTIDSEAIDAMVSEIRRYADQPFVYAVSKNRSAQARQLLAELKAMRSPCYPYAIFSIDGADTALDGADVDIISLDGVEVSQIQERVVAYASNRFDYDIRRLQLDHRQPLPTQVDVVIVGAGITAST